MLLQTDAAKVNAFSVALAQVAFQRVGVRAFERDTILPQRGLSGTNPITAFIVRAMIAGLRHEPWCFKADFTA